MPIRTILVTLVAGGWLLLGVACSTGADPNRQLQSVNGPISESDFRAEVRAAISDPEIAFVTESVCEVFKEGTPEEVFVMASDEKLTEEELQTLLESDDMRRVIEIYKEECERIF